MRPHPVAKQDVSGNPDASFLFMTTASLSYHIAEAACLRLSCFLPRVGLNADWCCDTWHLMHNYYLVQDEDSDDPENFRVVRRNLEDPNDYGDDIRLHFHIYNGDIEAFLAEVLHFRTTLIR